jgi:hypothetical protein
MAARAGQWSTSKDQRRVAMPIPSARRQYRRSWVARVLSRYQEFKKLIWMASDSRDGQNNFRPSDAEILSIPRYCYDASLLFRRMTLLQIDRDELARDEPLLLRELQGLCTLCGSKADCVRDLDRECKTSEPQDWREYCPNAATLNALGALQNCPRARQYLKAPHALQAKTSSDAESTINTPAKP